MNMFFIFILIMIVLITITVCDEVNNRAYSVIDYHFDEVISIIDF